MILPDPSAERNINPSEIGARKMPASWLLPDREVNTTGPNAVYTAASAYVATGLSVMPIAADGSKSPDRDRLPRVFDEAQQSWKTSWKIFQVRRPTPDDLEAWRDYGGEFGLAVIGGVVSGGAPGLGLEIIDFDTIELAAPWTERVERQVPGLVERLTHVQSPRPGLHLYYRCLEFGGSQKLACGPVVGMDGMPVVDDAGKLKKKTLIELKGEGGYCLAPPSPRFCHPSQKPYQFVDGKPDLLAIPIITPTERAVLLDTARSLSRWQEEPRSQRPATVVRPGAEGGRPGDDFNARASWVDILTPHGWTFVRVSGGEELWRRPGKTTGQSASVNYGDHDKLHVFSSNADPFEDEQTYSKFAAYALLNHGGDYRAAARALVQQGYGSPAAAAAESSIHTTVL